MAVSQGLCEDTLMLSLSSRLPQPVPLSTIGSGVESAFTLSDIMDEYVVSSQPLKYPSQVTDMSFECANKGSSDDMCIDNTSGASLSIHTNKNSEGLGGHDFHLRENHAPLITYQRLKTCQQ